MYEELKITVGKLISLLEEYDPDTEVFFDVMGGRRGPQRQQTSPQLVDGQRLTRGASREVLVFSLNKFNLAIGPRMVPIPEDKVIEHKTKAKEKVEANILAKADIIKEKP